MNGYSWSSITSPITRYGAICRSCSRQFLLSSLVMALSRPRLLALLLPLLALAASGPQGALDFTCDPVGVQASETVLCLVTVEGQQLSVAPGATTQLTLTAGTHVIQTTLTGTSAARWQPSVRTDTVLI